MASRSSNLIVAVRRGYCGAPSTHPDEWFEPLSVERNNWPVLPVNDWGNDEGLSAGSEREHLNRLEREQEGIR
jgi:hypothetical protein